MGEELGILMIIFRFLIPEVSMKKYLLVTLFFISSVSFAQERLILGIDAGTNIAGVHNTYTSPNTTYPIQPGYLLGIEAGYGINDKFALRAQFFLDERIIRSTTTYYDGPSTIARALGNEGDDDGQYLEIPLTLKYSFIGDRSQGYAFAGPVLAFGFDHSFAFNFGINAGIGVSHNITHIVTFFTEAGYTFGVTDRSGGFHRSFSRDLRINAGFLFNIALPIVY